ncbi:MAG: Nicotinate-nucleotide adenylyltransferase [Planctomycetota bacterium]
MRLGIYGGSFDPVHYGHLLLAESCREECRLDEIWFMPAGSPPHKMSGRLASARDRVAMLRLATSGHPAFRVDTREVDRGGVSYTVDSLEQIRSERPSDDLFLLLGADALADFPTWRSPARIAALAVLVTVRRAGSAAADLGRVAEAIGPAAHAQLVAHQVEMPQVDFSSRDLRARLSAGKSIRYRTPRPVERYLEESSLYRLAPG